MARRTVGHLAVVGFLLLVGGALPLVQPPAARAATHSLLLGHPPLVTPQTLRTDDDDDGQGCSVLVMQCGIMPTVCQPIVVVKKVVVPVVVVKKVFVPVQVIKVVKVFVPVAVQPTDTPPPPPTSAPITVKVKVTVPQPAPPPAATPTMADPLIGDPPMF